MKTINSRLCAGVLMSAGVAVSCAHAADPIASSRAALAAPKFVLLMPGAAPEPIALLKIGPDDKTKRSALTYLDAAGERQTRPLDEIIALAPASWLPTPESVAQMPLRLTSGPAMHRLDLVDGQRILGDLVAGEAGVGAAESVRFSHERLGVFSMPIDRVHRYEDDVQTRVELPLPPSTSADTVLLANGDVIEGFVATLGPILTIEPSGVQGGKRPPATEISIDQIAIVQLVNPMVAPVGSRVDLSDGTVVSAMDVGAQLETGKLTLRPTLADKDHDPVVLELTELSSLVPNAARLVPLSGLDISAQRPTAERPSPCRASILLDAPTPLGAADVLLPCPMSLEWTLPAQVTSISGYAQMDDRSFIWGDCVVTVSVVSRTGQPKRTLATSRINAANSTLTIGAEIGPVETGDRLRVHVDPGERGPVQDRIVLRRMLLVAGPK